MTFDKLMQIHAKSHCFGRNLFAMMALMMIIVSSSMFLPENSLFLFSLNLLVHFSQLVNNIAACHSWILPLENRIVD
jgi:hypothetical protein